MHVADRLIAARCRRFVGRTAERGAFLDAIASARSSVYLLYIDGPAGIGKSSLLNEFFCECQTTDIPALLLDGRYTEPSPQGFRAALSANAPHQQAADPWADFQAMPGPHIIFIDTYELLAPLDDWLRLDFLPQLADTLVVMAGQGLSLAWRTDLGWQGRIRTIVLGNLSADESRAYLTGRAVPEEQQQSVIAFTHGHPLALSLVADAFDQRPGMDFQAEAAPDVIKALLAHFVQKVPGPAHRAALEACSLVRWTTEDLLAEMLTSPDGHDLFQWLRGLSFIESGAFGLFPHDLAREMLAADVQWRNPDWFATLHERARAYYYHHFQQAQGAAQQRIMLDYLYLHRHSPLVRPYLEWQESGNIYGDTMKAADKQSLIAMVAVHEGQQSAALAATWLDNQPQGAVVFRDRRGQVEGFLHMVALHQTMDAESEADPAVDAAWRFLEQHAPPRPGEQATIVRFWMGRADYQAVSTVQSLVFVSAALHYLTTEGLAYSFFTCADPDFWAPMFTYAGLQRLPEVDFEVGGRRYGVYGHDWRAVPPAAWLDALVSKETAPGEPLNASWPETQPLLILNKAEFVSAVRCALRDCTSADRLGTNPLLQSRLVNERSGLHATVAQRVVALQSVLAEATESLRSLQRGDKLYRAVQAVYFHPTLTQEQAAEALDLPFSTFRRHAQAGLTHVADYLWQREVGGASR